MSGSLDMGSLDAGNRKAILRQVSIDPAAMPGYRAILFFKDDGELYLRLPAELGGTIISLSGLSPTERAAVLAIISEDVSTWQRSVIATTNTPPALPADEDRYLIGTIPDPGLWTGHPDEIAQWDATAGAWNFSGPVAGWVCYDVSAAAWHRYSGGAWKTCTVAAWISNGSDISPVDGEDVDLNGADIKDVNTIEGPAAAQLTIQGGDTAAGVLIRRDAASGNGIGIFAANGDPFVALKSTGSRTFHVWRESGLTRIDLFTVDEHTGYVNVMAGFNASGVRLEDVGTPIADTDAATKLYVDQIAQGLEYKESIKDFFDPTGGLPLAPVFEDRYIATATANGWTVDRIYEFTDDGLGGAWVETIPNDGWALMDENVSGVPPVHTIWVYSSAAWVLISSLQNHNDLGGIGTDDHHAKDHAARHSPGGGDTVNAEDLAEDTGDTGYVLTNDGDGTISWQPGAGDVEAMSTSGAEGTVPVSDGAGDLTMEEILGMFGFNISGSGVAGNQTAYWGQSGVYAARTPTEVRFPKGRINRFTMNVTTNTLAGDATFEVLNDGAATGVQLTYLAGTTGVRTVLIGGGGYAVSDGNRLCVRGILGGTGGQAIYPKEMHIEFRGV